MGIIYLSLLQDANNDPYNCVFFHEIPTPIPYYCRLGHPTSFMPSYTKGQKISKEYQASMKTVEMEKPTNSQIDIVRTTDISELGNLQSILYYDLRLENSIFTDQEISYNHCQLSWRHQVQTDVYEQLPACQTAPKPISNCVGQKVGLEFIFNIWLYI